MVFELSTKQNLADKFTNDTLTAVYGKRFTSLKDVEEDEELNMAWDSLNEKFYDLLTNFINNCYGSK